MLEKTKKRRGNAVHLNNFSRNFTSFVGNLQADFIRAAVWLLLVKG